MNIRPVFRFLLTGILLLILTGKAGAQDYSLSDTLRKISREMYEEHNSSFITVEALKDGLLRDGQNYHWLFENNTIKLNDEELKEPYKSRYLALMNSFFTNGRQKRDGHSSHSIRSTLTVKEVLDPLSSFHRGSSYQISSSDVKSTIIHELIRDGVADTTRTVAVRFTKAAVVVNDKTLPADLEEKYRMLLRIIGRFEAKEERDIYLLLWRK